MLFRQMKYFMAVVDAKSFTEASYALEISQSAVSQQIKALEEDLGVPLLIRHHRRFALTPAATISTATARNCFRKSKPSRPRLVAKVKIKNSSSASAI